MNTILMYNSRMGRLRTMVFNRYCRSSSLEDISKQNWFCDPLAERGEKRKEKFERQATYFLCNIKENNAV